MEEFSIVYDVYLEILHRVDIRVNAALHRDEPERRLKNICPPCTYALQDEPKLSLSILCAMDGNSSLKLVDTAFRSGTARRDDRTARTDIWITSEEVDVLKDEVGSSSGSKVRTKYDTGTSH